ncbi:MAG: hypothetical protein V7L09_08010 [Nostoc sp.]|uniref:hypothetical protein n=1 Tax=Nostoc sp. TaxID=1180 RepID=UPI002FF2D629
MSNEWMKNGYLLITYYLLLITHVVTSGGVLEPVEDPVSWDNLELERSSNQQMQDIK